MLEEESENTRKKSMAYNGVVGEAKQQGGVRVARAVYRTCSLMVILGIENATQ